MNFADTNWLASAYALFSKYAWEAAIGTFDTAIVASVKLAGGKHFLSFDLTARTLAAAEGIEVYPALNAQEKQLVLRLKHKGGRQ